MKIWEQMLARGAVPSVRSASSFQDWVNLLGQQGPFMPTTWATTSDEELTRSVDEAYRSNGPVFALVLARLQLFSQARFQWTQWSGGNPQDLYGSPDLSVLERPWTGGTTADLLARMEVGVSTSGNSFTRRIRRGSGLTKVDRLSQLNPNWTSIVMGSQEDADHPGDAGDTELVGYLYKPGGKPENTIALEPHEVAHYAPLPDPANNFVGMSWVTPVIGELLSDDASEVHKRRYFQNAATPNLAIKFDPQTTVEQIRAFKELLEDEHQGHWNAYKTLYLGGGADPVSVGSNFQQLDFAKTQGKGESRLAAAAGVPPSWVGFSEGLQGSALNAGNFTAARRRLGDGTMHHLWGNAASSLEVILKRPDNRAALWYDTRSIPFLREDSKDAAEVQAKEAETISQLVNGGFTPESAVKAVQNSDWSQLKHSGLLSVQLQVPGSTPGTDPGQDPKSGAKP